MYIFVCRMRNNRSYHDGAVDTPLITKLRLTSLLVFVGSEMSSSLVRHCRAESMHIATYVVHGSIAINGPGQYCASGETRQYYGFG